MPSGPGHGTRTGRHRRSTVDSARSLLADDIPAQLDAALPLGLGDEPLAGAEALIRDGSTGRPLDARFAHLWRVADGRLLRLRQVTDATAWWRAPSSG